MADRRRSLWRKRRVVGGRRRRSWRRSGHGVLGQGGRFGGAPLGGRVRRRLGRRQGRRFGRWRWRGLLGGRFRCLLFGGLRGRFRRRSFGRRFSAKARGRGGFARIADWRVVRPVHALFRLVIAVGDRAHVRFPASSAWQAESRWHGLGRASASAASSPAVSRSLDSRPGRPVMPGKGQLAPFRAIQNPDYGIS
ncbi:MAG: hypothetical protein BWZ10_02200 [candidate division BRC1 bacterium ADurb.BinA364]|nr:MAG: hypothetical protein BWZ10_02200 [candidate division BRC1 bacterium ADurb.BinA364]